MACLVVTTLAGCGGEAEGLSAIEVADVCQDCHLEQAASHADSRHAVAATSPVFVALRGRAIDDLGSAAGAFCDDCHRPEGGTERGLGCLSCHAAAANRGTRNGRLVLDVSGPVRSAGASGPSVHATAASGFLTSAKLCGTCHQVDGPAGFSESPFSHWQGSSFAERGVTCADCHMSETPGVPVERRVSHAPRGFDDDEAGDLLARGARLGVERDGARATVVLENSGAGHNFPDGASFLRELELVVEADGVEVRRWWLSSRLEARGVEVVSPTAADTVVSHALASGEIRRYELDVAVSSTVKACLRFRRYRPDLLADLGLDPALAGPRRVVLCASKG